MDKDLALHGGLQNLTSSPAKVAEKLTGAGNLGKSENIRVMVEEAAKAQGLNPRDAVKGFERFMEALRTYSSAKIAPDIAAVETARKAEAGLAPKIAAPLGRLARALEDMRRAKSYREVAAILQSPDGIAKLSQMSKYSPWSGFVQATLADLVNAANVTAVESQQVTPE
jgi:hypothetical protein